MKRGTLITVAAVVFLWTLLMQAPASLVYGRLKPHLPGLTLFGVDGTVASGSAAGFSFGGRAVDEKLQWHLRPLWLLLGRTAADVDASGDVQFSGGLQYGLGGLRLRHAQAHSDLKPLASMMNLGFAPLSGGVEAQLDWLRVSGGALAGAQGRIELHGLALTLGPSPVPLGDFRAALDTAGDAVTATISTLSGPLEVDGTIGYGRKDQRYDVDLRLHPRGPVDPMIGNWLRTLGAPDPQGFSHLHRTGLSSLSALMIPG